MPDKATDISLRILMIGLIAVIFLACSLSAGPIYADDDKKERVIAIIPVDSPPTYYKDKQTGKAAGFAVDVMDRIAARAGLVVDYIFEDDWQNIIEKIINGKADIVPDMGISEGREKVLDFTEPVDVFPVSFFVRSGSKWAGDDNGERHVVGVIKGSVAYEHLKDRPKIDLATYQTFSAGLFDLLAGKIDSFACPAPTLHKLAIDSGVEDKIKIVGKPITEVRRAIAVRKDNKLLLQKISKAMEGYIGTPEYKEIYIKWYGKPRPFWTVSRVIYTAAGFLLLVISIMTLMRHFEIQQYNRQLLKNIAEREKTESALKESEEKFRTLFDKSADAILIVDTDGKIIDANELALVRYKYRREEITGMPIGQLDSPDDAHNVPHRIEMIKKFGTAIFEAEHITSDGIIIPAEVNTRMVHIAGMPAFLSTCRDITERKKAEALIKLDEDRLNTLLKLTQMHAVTESDITDFALEEAVRLTMSKGGYLHFFNQDEQTIGLYSWSKDVLNICSAVKDEHYPLAKAGVWADSVRKRQAVIHNDYQGLEAKRGYPEGHFHLIRHLGVPVFDEDRIVCVTGVGNKEEPYNESDAVQLSLFMNGMWGILKQRKTDIENQRLVIELQESLSKVKMLSGMLPICASCKKIRDDKGYWNQVETYISKHSGAEFSHGLCPVCEEKTLKEVREYKKSYKREEGE